MSLPAPVSRPPSRLLVLVLGFFVLVRAGSAQPGKEKPAQLTPDAVKAIQKQYLTERAAAEKDGLTKKFSPEWYERAASLAKQGAAALKANRLIEARDSFRRARWSLPSLPASLPPHVARILGDGRLRHG